MSMPQDSNRSPIDWSSMQPESRRKPSIVVKIIFFLSILCFIGAGLFGYQYASEQRHKIVYDNAVPCASNSTTNCKKYTSVTVSQLYHDRMCPSGSGCITTYYVDVRLANGQTQTLTDEGGTLYTYLQVGDVETTQYWNGEITKLIGNTNGITRNLLTQYSPDWSSAETAIACILSVAMGVLLAAIPIRRNRRNHY